MQKEEERQKVKHRIKLNFIVMAVASLMCSCLIADSTDLTAKLSEVPKTVAFSITISNDKKGIQTTVWLPSDLPADTPITAAVAHEKTTKNTFAERFPALMNEKTGTDIDISQDKFSPSVVEHLGYRGIVNCTTLMTAIPSGKIVIVEVREGLDRQNTFTLGVKIDHDAVGDQFLELQTLQNKLISIGTAGGVEIWPYYLSSPIVQSEKSNGSIARTPKGTLTNSASSLPIRGKEHKKAKTGQGFIKKQSILLPIREADLSEEQRTNLRG
jgi:hypothetical protein